jgi:hypothetical protein
MKVEFTGIAHDILAAYGGIWLIPTGGIRQLSQPLTVTDKAASQLAPTIAGATHRNLDDNRFVGEDDMQRFFNSAGCLEDHPSTSVVNEMPSPQPLNLERKPVTSQLQWLLTLWGESRPCGQPPLQTCSRLRPSWHVCSSMTHPWSGSVPMRRPDRNGRADSAPR